MAILTADFTVTFDFLVGKITIKDTTGGKPPNNDLKNWEGFITNITNPLGETIYENTVAGTPDFIYYTPEEHTLDGQIILEKFYPNPTSSTDIPIPQLSEGRYMFGNYLFSIKLVGSGNEYIATKTLTVDYEKPEGSLEVTYNVVDPEFKSVDATDYSLDGYTASIVRTHTISFPNNLRPDFSSSQGTITTDTFYTTQQVVTLSTEATWTKGDLIVTDTIEAEEAGDDSYVVVVQDLEQIYLMVHSLYQEYVSASSTNSGRASRIFPDLMIANTLLSLLRAAIRYENTDNINAYAEKIKDIAKRWDCSCSSPSPTPTLVTGLYLVDIDTVTPAYASDDQGADFAFVPVEGTHTYIAFYAHPHQNTPVQSDYAGLWVKFVGEGGGSDLGFDGNREVSRDGVAQVNAGGTTVTEFLENYFFPAYEPSVTEPSIYATITGPAKREVGTFIEETITIGLNRGAINGKLVGGSWNPDTFQNYRSGEVTEILLEGASVPFVDNESSEDVTKTLALGSNEWLTSVSFAEGVQPTNSTGGASAIHEPYPAGSLNKTITIIGEYKIFYGSTSFIPTTSAHARAKTGVLTSNGSTIILNTGTTDKMFAVFVPDTLSITQVVDLDAANQVITSDYALYNDAYTVNDAGGNAVTYKFYLVQNTVSYSTNHRHQITIS